MKAKSEPKNYCVVSSKHGNYLVRQIGQGLESDVLIHPGPLTYNDASDLRDEENNDRAKLKAELKADSKEDLQQLITLLDKFTEPEIIKALRGDNNVGIRRKAKGLATKLASAAIKTGMEAMQVQPVKK